MLSTWIFLLPLRGQSRWKLWTEDRAKPGKINGNYLWKKAWEGGKGRISLWTKEKPQRVLHRAGILEFHTKHPEQAEFPKIPGNELLFSGRGAEGCSFDFAQIHRASPLPFPGNAGFGKTECSRRNFSREIILTSTFVAGNQGI